MVLINAFFKVRFIAANSTRCVVVSSRFGLERGLAAIHGPSVFPYQDLPLEGSSPQRDAIKLMP